jgi:hypothetical protein
MTADEGRSFQENSELGSQRSCESQLRVNS